jgi:hypothetical protein
VADCRSGNIANASVHQGVKGVMYRSSWTTSLAATYRTMYMRTFPCLRPPPPHSGVGVHAPLMPPHARRVHLPASASANRAGPSQ